MSLQVPREGLTQKLQRLSQSQQSIESVSSFCIFYSKDARGVVQIWEQEFYKAQLERKLALLYLANHILQEGRKKGMAFQEEFFKVLPKAISHMGKHADDKAKRSLTRIVSVWEERRVFGTRHIKSFKDALGVPASTAATAGAKPAAAAAAGSGADATAVAKLGPAGDALSLVLQKAAATAAKSQEFTSSWSQNLLTSAGLPEVSSAHSKLGAYATALQEELAARQAAINTLKAELAKQTAEVGRIELQLQTVDGQQQQLDARLANLASQLSAVAGLGQLFQQRNGAAAGLGAGAPAAAAGAAAAAAGSAAGDAGGSPQAPDLELDEEPAAAGGAMGLQPNPVPQQQQQQPPQIITHDLQALLANPQMLSAAITGAQRVSAAPVSAAAASAPASMGFSGQAMGLQMGLPAAGVQLQLPTGPVPVAGAMPPGGSFAFAAAPPPQQGACAAGSAAVYGMQGGGYVLQGQQQQGSYGGLVALQQQQSGFADEADDPYDPEHAD